MATTSPGTTGAGGPPLRRSGGGDEDDGAALARSKTERPRAGTFGSNGSGAVTAARARWSAISSKLFGRLGRPAHAGGALPRMSSADDMYLTPAEDQTPADDYWHFDAQNPRTTPGYTSTASRTAPSAPATDHAAGGPAGERAAVGRTSPAAMGAGQWRARRLFKLDDLERVHVLGHGFFSEVSLVVDRRAGDKYALKSIKQFKDAASRLAFIQETEMLRMLHHPNILRQRGMFVNATGLHVLTDYIERGTLRKLLKAKDVDITDRHKVHFAYDIALGMRYLHEHTVMHRDLKSKNCLVTEGGRIIIADFGLAMHLPSPLAESSGQAGTAYWMAPEMLHGHSYGLAADVFSYGIVLCEIITRLKAAPTEDGIPRLSNFGLDVDRFRELAGACFPPLVDLAIDCCQMDPAARPLFDAIVERLEAMIETVDEGQPDLLVPVPATPGPLDRLPSSPATPNPVMRPPSARPRSLVDTGPRRRLSVEGNPDAGGGAYGMETILAEAVSDLTLTDGGEAGDLNETASAAAAESDAALS